MYLFLLLCMFLSVSSIDQLHLKPKFCVNCKYFIETTYLNRDNGKCSLFPNESKDYLVSGVKKPENYYYCSTARSWDNMCGPDAKKYKKKYKTKKTKKNETSNELPTT